MQVKLEFDARPQDRAVSGSAEVEHADLLAFGDVSTWYTVSSQLETSAIPTRLALMGHPTSPDSLNSGA